MAQESIENVTDAAETSTRKAVLAAQDLAERAGSYVQDQITRLSEHAQSLVREADDRMKDYSGRPTEAWIAEIRTFVRAHPLQMLAATIGVGYILGKLLKR